MNSLQYIRTVILDISWSAWSESVAYDAVLGRFQRDLQVLFNNGEHCDVTTAGRRQSACWWCVEVAASGS